MQVGYDGDNHIIESNMAFQASGENPRVSTVLDAVRSEAFYRGIAQRYTFSTVDLYLREDHEHLIRALSIASEDVLLFPGRSRS